MFVAGLIQILYFSKIFLAASLQNLSNSFGTLLETFRIQMCWRQLLCFWLQELLGEKKSLFDARLSLQLLPAAMAFCLLQQMAKMISSKRLLSFLPLLLRALSSNRGNSMSLQSLVASSHGTTLIAGFKLDPSLPHSHRNMESL